MNKKFLEAHTTKETRSICGLFELYEENYGKELYKFTKQEILQMYKDQKMGKATSYRLYNQIGRTYCQFQVGDSCAFGEITLQDLRGCVQKKEFISRETLDLIEERLLNDIDRAVLELAWEGVAECNAVTSINMEMISTPDKVLHLEGREIYLSDELYAYLVEGMTQKVYYSYGRSGRSTPIEKNRSLYKPKANAKNPYADEAKRKWYLQLVKRISDYVGIKFTALDIRNSGLYYKLKEIAEEDGYNGDIKLALSSAKGQILKKEYGLKGDQALLLTLDNYQEATQG